MSNNAVDEKLKKCGDIVFGIYATYLMYSDKSIKVSPKFMTINLYFSSEEEIERYRYYRWANNLKNIDKLLDEAIQVINLI